jgi:uncharacterized protein (TIGR00251 family)
MTTTLSVKVVPRASCDEIVGWHGSALKIRVAAPPQDGKANAALEALLATALGLKRSAVSVVAGHGSPRKLVAIAGLDRATIERLLASRT